MIPPLQLQNAHYGAVVANTTAVQKALREIAAGIGATLKTGVTGGGPLVSGMVLPAEKGTVRFATTFHFDPVPAEKPRAKAGGKKPLVDGRVLWHAHLTKAPASQAPPELVALRDQGRTTQWIFKILDGIFPAGMLFFAEAELTATGDLPLPSSIQTVQLLAPPLGSGPSDGLELVGAEYRIKKNPTEDGLREFRWSRDESGKIGLHLGYMDKWETGIGDPWTHQLTRASEHIRNLR